MVVVYIACRLDIREATRLLIAWNVGACAFLVMIAVMVADPRRDALGERPRHALQCQ
jgi:hypothetical protein